MNLETFVGILLTLLVFGLTLNFFWCPAQKTSQTYPEPARPDPTQPITPAVAEAPKAPEPSRLEVLQKKLHGGDYTCQEAMELLQISDVLADVITIARVNRKYDGWKTGDREMIMEKLDRLADCPAHIIEVLSELKKYLRSHEVDPFHQKWLLTSTTFDEVKDVPKFYGDDMLENVRQQKVGRLARQALSEAPSCVAIMTIWLRIPDTYLELKAESLSNLPGWQNDEGLDFSHLPSFHDMSQQASENSLSRGDIGAKWYKLSERESDNKTIQRYKDCIPFVHPQTQEAWNSKWDAACLALIPSLQRPIAATEASLYCRPDSDALRAVLAHWDELSTAAIEASPNYYEARSVFWQSREGSTTRTACLSRCIELATTEAEIRSAWELEGLTPEQRTLLGQKLEKTLLQ